LGYFDFVAVSSPHTSLHLPFAGQKIARVVGQSSSDFISLGGRAPRSIGHSSQDVQTAVPLEVT